MKIHQKIIKTLLSSSIVIAIVVSMLTLYVEFGHIQEKVLFLAKNEVNYFIKNIELQNRIKQNEIDISNTGFLSITLFNNKDEFVYSKEVKNYTNILNELKQIDHHLVTKSNEKVEERVIHNHLQNKFYFQFKTPTHMLDFNGYIKGLYQISDEDIQKIYINITYSILQLVLTVFATTLLLYPIIIYLNKEYKKQSENLFHANLEIMSVLGGAVAKRDNDTNAHNYRVTLYSIAFGEKLELEHDKMMGLIKGAFLHDVGKIGITDSILLKPGKLSDIEFEKMKYHVEFGIEIISKSKWLDDAKDVVAYHHEKFDGTGYNKGLSAEQIPLNARIFMICDVFDALTSKRPYKDEFTFEESIKIIRENSGTHFDPKLVSIFCTIIKDLYFEISHLEDEGNLQNMLDKKLNCIEC